MLTLKLEKVGIKFRIQKISEMFVKNKLLISYVLTLAIWVSVMSSTISAKKCMIKNELYQNEYLVADQQKESILSHLSYNILEDKLYESLVATRRRVFTYRLEIPLSKSVNDYVKESAQWDIIEYVPGPAAMSDKDGYDNRLGKPKVFLIKSVMYQDEYLCASWLHTNDLLKTRRKVFTLKVNQSTHEFDRVCLWTFEKQKLGKRELNVQHRPLVIWNVMWKEPLYAASSIFNTNLWARSVFMWHRKPDSFQFYWHLSCQQD